MMKRSISGVLIILIILMTGLFPAMVINPGLVLAAPDEDTVIVAPGTPIQIAAQMTSIFSTTQDHYDAIQMAINEFGLIKGFNVLRNDFLDDCDETSGQTIATEILDNAQIVGVIGPICSVATLGAAPVFNTYDVVMISPANTNDGVQLSGPRVFNRVVVMDPHFDIWEQVIIQRPSVQDWEARFATTYGRPPDFIAKYAYEAAILLLTRIDQMSQLDGSGNLILSRKALEAAVRNTSGFQGITGLISLDVQGNRILTPRTYVGYDPFSQATLNSSWSWLGTMPTQWSLATLPGFLEIYTQDDQANRLVMQAPRSDFEMRTFVQFTPVENFQFGGLLVYGDENNFMAFGRAYCDPFLPNCVGNGIYFDYVEGGVAMGSNFATTTTGPSNAYLRIVVQGANATGYLSENGTEWTEIGTHTIGFVPQKVGLIVSNALQPVTEIPAYFDFFVLQYEAERTSLPLVFR
jgi:hypothetical protein